MRRSLAVGGRVALALTWTALAVPAARAAAPETSVGQPAAAPVTDRIIVQWESGVTSADRVAARADADTTLLRTLGAPAFQLVRPEQGQTVADALAALRDDPNVRTAARDGYSVLHATTNDPLINQLWGLKNLGLGVDGFGGALAGADIDAASAWDRTRGSAAIVIADIDSGYRFDAPDLAAVAWSNPADPQDGADNDGNGIVDDSHGADFVGPSANSPAIDGDPTDDNLISGGHGVHTAGTMGAAGNNGVGISGVAQDVRIMPLRVCGNDAPANVGSCPFSSQILAINYAGSHGARVANMSLGGLSFRTDVRDAIAHNPQTLFVISAGNDGQNNDLVPHYPCAYDPSTSGIAGAIDNIVCVAATDQADGLAGFSDWGAASVDLGAPGTETLSTYPTSEVRFSETFEANDFGSTWSNTGGSGFGRAAAGDGPLTSFGMNDSPGAAPVSLSFHEVTLTTGTAVPAGYGACALSGMRYRSAGGGSFYYEVLSDNVAVFTNTGSADTGGTSLVSFSTVPIDGLAGHAVQARFGFTAGSSPTTAHGIWLDDLKLECSSPLSTPPGYDFLEGTSMAAPHVTGAAGLLFSLKPSATVAEVRSALLSTVDPVASLAGKTTTGGRLDVSAALDRLVPPDTAVTSGPPAKTTSTSATFSFNRSDSAVAATFECRIDGAVFAACVSPASFTVAFGSHAFDVRAKDVHGNLDPTPASYAWRFGACKVPKLKGKTLRQARKALARSHCKVGKVVKPKKRKGHKLPPLVVGSSKPKAGKTLAEDAKVRLRLIKKPKPTKHRR